MKIAICGSEDFDNYELLEEKCDKITSKLREIIVLTLGKGAMKHEAERTAREWAAKRRYVMRIFHGDKLRTGWSWEKAIEEMLDEAKLVICFGECDEVTEAAEERGIPIRRFK